MKILKPHPEFYRKYKDRILEKDDNSIGVVVGYITHSRLPISLYIIEEHGPYSRSKSSLFDFVKEINFKLKCFQENEDTSTRYTIRHIRELEFD